MIDALIFAAFLAFIFFLGFFASRIVNRRKVKDASKDLGAKSEAGPTLGDFIASKLPSAPPGCVWELETKIENSKHLNFQQPVMRLFLVLLDYSTPDALNPDRIVGDWWSIATPVADPLALRLSEFRQEYLIEAAHKAITKYRHPEGQVKRWLT